MTIITGKITDKFVFQNVEQRADGEKHWTERAVFEINAIKLGTFDAKLIEAFNKGDEVSAEYLTTKDGRFNNIINIKLLQIGNAKKTKKYRIVDLNLSKDSGTITLEEL